MVLATWSKLVVWKVAGQLFGFHWNIVRKAVKNVVDYGLANRDLVTLFTSASMKSPVRGHMYHTQVYDLIEKRLLWSGEDRTSETLEAFFDYLGQDRCGHIRAVRCDMWAPYVDAIKNRLPNALLVFDKFHIVRHLLDAVDTVRKEKAQKLNLKINRACLLKKAFRKFWDYSHKAWAKKYLVQWFWRATHSRLKTNERFRLDDQKAPG
jgi:transposase